METILRVQNLSKKFERQSYSLEDISFELAKGEMLFITGSSGTGKSTLLRLLALLTPPSSGEIWFNDQNVSNLASRKIPRFRRMMGLIFQEPMLLSDRNIFDNVALPLVIGNYEYKDMARKVRASLEKVSLLDKESMFPHQLSAGEQQRVSIARAIVHRPLIVLADEPTGNLDPSLSLEIFKLFDELSNVGISSIIATHDQYLIEPLDKSKLILHKNYASGFIL